MKRFLSVLILVMMLCTLAPALCSAETYHCKKCGIKGMANWSGKVSPKSSGGLVSPKQSKCKHEFVPDGSLRK